MNSDVSQRFVACHDQLKAEGKVKSTRQFALSLDYAPQSFSDILKGRRDVTIDLIRKAVEKYHFNATFIFSGIGSYFLSPHQQAQDPIISVVTNNQGKELITHVPVAAQAGYGEQLYNAEFMAELPAFTLPGHRFSSGTFRCFDIDGESMEPTLCHGDKVVCAFIEKEYWGNTIRDNCVYVVVTDSTVVVKRIVNNLTGDNTIQCTSDNDFFEPFDIHLQKIKEVWKVEMKISNFQHAHSIAENTLEEELSSLRKAINQQSNQIKQLSKSIDHIGIRPRSSYL